MSQYDAEGLHYFLAQTPESGLRKILVDRKSLTDVHCNLLIKVVKACNAEQFAMHFEKQDFPKLRMSPNEEKIKEKFWAECTTTLLELGILQPLVASQKAAA